jgi:NAD(P)-dependent dehydrogenase (short-subunit alcohol dehydrogenase family)
VSSIPTDPAKPLSQEHAIITGGGSGIGAAVAAELARLGARLTLIGRREQRLVETAAIVTRAHGVACGYQCVDVTDAEATARAFAHFEAESILVNNAGAAASAPFLKTDLGLLEDMMAINCYAAFRSAQAVLPAMLKARRGRIVNIASTAGMTGYAYVTAYCAAKHALVGLTRSLAQEVAKTGITVNAVCPGYTDTDLVAKAVENIVAKTGRTGEAARAELAASNPLGRLVRPEEVAAAVGFLCLPSSASVTGQAIVVAGGEIMP